MQGQAGGGGRVLGCRSPASQRSGRFISTLQDRLLFQGKRRVVRAGSLVPPGMSATTFQIDSGALEAPTPGCVWQWLGTGRSLVFGSSGLRRTDSLGRTSLRPSWGLHSTPAPEHPGLIPLPGIKRFSSIFYYFSTSLVCLLLCPIENVKHLIELLEIKNYSLGS